MRLYEFESKTKAEVYIDMDGVLVDFFDAWAKLMGEKSFRDIKDIDKGLQAIRDTDDFWLNLKPTPNAGKLLALVRKLKGSYTILSSPLADDPRSEPHKRMWVEKNLKQFPPKKVIITGNKAKYAQQSDGTPNILIDDFGQNIAKWEAAGGIGVKHKDHKFERTLQSLMQHLNKDEKVKEYQFEDLHEYVEYLNTLEEASLAQKVGAGALAVMMGLAPVAKAFGMDTNTSPLPDKQTSTMVQKDAGQQQDLGKIQMKKPPKELKKSSLEKPGMDYYKAKITIPGKGSITKHYDIFGIRDADQLKNDLLNMFPAGAIEVEVEKIKNPLPQGQEVKIDQSILKKLIKELEKRNGKQSFSYLSGMAEKAGAKPGEGGAYAVAAQKAYHGLK